MACCVMLPIEAIGKPANTRCPHCASGCSIHASKPLTCFEYECAYFQAPKVPVELRPDKCGVIFTKRTDRIFSGVKVTGVKVTEVARQQILNFMKQGYSVVLLSVEASRPRVLLAEGHDAKSIVREYEESLGGHLQH